jgi:hypothetical protein
LEVFCFFFFPENSKNTKNKKPLQT